MILIKSLACMHRDLHFNVIPSLHHQNWIIFLWKHILVCEIWSFGWIWKILRFLCWSLNSFQTLLVNIGCLTWNTITRKTTEMNRENCHTAFTMNYLTEQYLWITLNYIEMCRLINGNKFCKKRKIPTHTPV